MSSLTPQELSDFETITYVAISALALLSYDTLLTLPSEVKYVWKGKFMLATVLYSMARYGELLSQVIYIWLDTSDITLEVCLVGTRLSGSMSVLSSLGKQGLLIAQTYAISQQNYVVLVVLGYLSLSSIITGIMQISNNSCSTSGAASKLANLENTIGSILSLIFDTVVLVVTLYMTLGIVRLQRQLKNMPRNSLSSIILQHGILCYIFVFITTLGGVVNNLLAQLWSYGVAPESGVPEVTWGSDRKRRRVQLVRCPTGYSRASGFRSWSENRIYFTTGV